MSIVDTCSNVISVNSFKGKTDDSLVTCTKFCL